MNLKKLLFWKPKRRTEVAGLPTEEVRAAAYLQGPPLYVFLVCFPWQ